MAGPATKRQKRSTTYLPDHEAHVESTKDSCSEQSNDSGHMLKSSGSSLERRKDLLPIKTRTIPSERDIRHAHRRASPSQRPSTENSPSCGAGHGWFGTVDKKEAEDNTQASSLYQRTENNNDDDDDDDDDDIIDDYDSYDELFSNFADEDALYRDPSNGLPNSQGQSYQSSFQNFAGPPKFNYLPKRFLIPPAAEFRNEQPGSLPHTEGHLPWAHKFPPRDIGELAVHKKKISDVGDWLKLAFSGNANHRLLILRGPAGSGKTATISLLSRALGFEVVEWRNPPVSDYATGNYVSLGKKLDEFLERGNGFNVLDLDLAPLAPLASEDKGTSGQNSTRRILLIEEFPTFNRHSPSLAAFRSSLQRCLATSNPQTASTSQAQQMEDTGAPVVIVVSETHLSSESSLSDNITAHRLLGAEICNHANTTIIDFNSIAPTFMQKALNLVLSKNARHSGHHASPGDAVLRIISKAGDIRSAINALQVLCLQSNDFKEPCGKTRKPKRPDRTRTSRQPPDNEPLDLLGQREVTLGIFHAVGKIMYNKRQEIHVKTGVLKQPSPPSHILQHDRPKPPQVSVDDLANETGTDIPTFIGALHENYVPSCDGPSFTECLNGCIDALSDCDLLCANGRSLMPSWPGNKIASWRGNSGLDVLRQDEISYQVATRGLLFSLPHPVKRCAPTGRPDRRHNAHQMYFPATFRLMHDMEEIEGLANLWMKRSLSPSVGLNIEPMLKVDTAIHSKTSQGVETAPDNGTYSSVVTMICRTDLFLYQLPYLAMISSEDAYSRDLRKITGIGGIRAQHDTLEQRSDFSSIPLKPKNRAANKAAFGPQLPLMSNDKEESLILSDDDIVDD